MESLEISETLDRAINDFDIMFSVYYSVYFD